MARRTGSFGLLKLHYEITDDHVIITRNVWLPFALLALAPPGAWCLVQAFSHRHLDGTMFGVGFVGAMLGLFALLMTPWLTPGRITVTREGIAWGSAKYARQAIVAIHAQSAEMRSSQYGRYQSWTIIIALANGKPLVLSLGNRNRAASTEPLVTLERAMTALLPRRA